jgi:radical SAM protein with 4Fe4S-binding SPASM domain
MDTFVSGVKQASALGARSIWLTPMLGDVFADPSFEDKFQYLETYPNVDRFAFFTNFILPKQEAITRLSKLRKLAAIHISIYGHDQDSFELVTQKPSSQYNRLLKNLVTLEATLADRVPIDGIHFSIRTLGRVNSSNLPDTDLTRQLRQLNQKFNTSIIVSEEYDNWNGSISDEDIKPLGIELTDGKNIYKSGACTLLFSGARIASDGNVHACACRDTDGSLLIGNLSEQPLSEIISSGNPAYKNIIKNQQAGNFSKNCQSCSMYRSIYDHRPSAQDDSLVDVSLDTALDLMAVK